jgi:uncharacterized protein
MRIAIIGGGISGMTAAHLLSRDHDVTLFESDARIGGHTHTVTVNLPGGRSYAVDTGFIVFNATTYPNFMRLLQRLGVPWQPSDMSFSVQCERTGLLFSPKNLDALFVQRRNLLRPGFYRMLADAQRFRRAARRLMASGDDTTTLGAYLRANRYGTLFTDQFLLPMSSALWSSDPDRVGDFPVRYLAQFFHNHGFLNMRHQPQWLTVRGGSNSYIEPLVRPFRENIRLNSPVTAVRRAPDGVSITVAHQSSERFDHVVMANHSDQALRMLADATDAERSILGAIPYQENLAVLHTDRRLLPSSPAAWSSWNYHIPAKPLGRASLTYLMNRLQNLDAPETLCVTLNRPDAIAPERVLARMVYHHPIYDPPGLKARRQHALISGHNRTHYCGAYWGYGFHEDGVNSALAVAANFGRGLG